MDDKIKINLLIADSYFPATIDRADEEKAREAAKQVNMKLNTFRERYKNQPPEKLLALVAYQFSLEKLNLMERNDTQPYASKIEELTTLLEEYFKED